MEKDTMFVKIRNKSKCRRYCYGSRSYVMGEGPYSVPQELGKTLLGVSVGGEPMFEESDPDAPRAVPASPPAPEPEKPAAPAAPPAKTVDEIVKGIAERKAVEPPDYVMPKPVERPMPPPYKMPEPEPEVEVKEEPPEPEPEVEVKEEPQPEKKEKPKRARWSRKSTRKHK